MASNKVKFNKKIFSQLSLVLTAFILIFFIYFYGSDKENLNIETDKDSKIISEDTSTSEKTNIFEDVEYKGVDQNGNKFVVKSEFSQFKIDKPEIINMENIVCYFYFKDGTILEIRSKSGMMNNLTYDLQFRNNVEMYYLDSILFSEKADYKNSESNLLVEENVIGKDSRGNISADKLNFDIIDKKLTISMYNDLDRVNVKTKIK
tara:strand:- start:11028 stop:11642 length:615 start_codon:yes stop_codon:yes gene_type:complete